MGCSCVLQALSWWWTRRSQAIRHTNRQVADHREASFTSNKSVHIVAASFVLAHVLNSTLPNSAILIYKCPASCTAAAAVGRCCGLPVDCSCSHASCHAYCACCAGVCRSRNVCLNTSV
jgi:hypothetical protein